MASPWLSATQIASNVATVLALVYAGATLNLSTVDAKVANSTKILDQGIRVESDYKDGKIQAREVVAFYYQVFLYHKLNRMLDEVYVPVDRNLCNFMLTDPRAKEYWATDAKHFDQDFIDFIASRTDPKSC